MSNPDLETSHDYTWIRLLQIILECFGIAGSCFIILIFFNNLKRLTPAFEFITQLSLSSLLNSASFLILFIYTDQELFNPKSCKAQGFLMLFSELSLLIVSTNISIYTWRTKAKFTSEDKFNCKERITYLSINYIIPLIISLCCLGIIGLNGRWCWIDARYRKSYAFIEYVICWILIILNLVFACLIKRISYENLHQEDIKYRKEYISKLVIYPYISVICWLPATIYRLIGLYGLFRDTQYDIEFYFHVVHIIFRSIRGLIFAIVSFISIYSGKNLKKVLISFFNFCYKIPIEPEHHDDLNEFLSGTPRITIVKSRSGSFVGSEKQDAHRDYKVLN